MSTELTLAAGCFWCLDAVLRRTRGVEEVLSGYTGGHTAEPDYDSVCSGLTGHAEAVRVRFDEEIVPEDIILDIFFTSHDPTQLNRQGHDIGTQYRSAMFYRDDAERLRFESAISAQQANWDRPIVTTLEPLGEFYEAEPVHQDFYNRNPFSGYCQVIINPKLSKARQGFSAWVG